MFLHVDKKLSFVPRTKAFNNWSAFLSQNKSKNNLRTELMTMFYCHVQYLIINVELT